MQKGGESSITTVQYRPSSFSLTVAGHAGAGRRGEDLVCAGVSTLCWTLLEAARAEPGYHAEASCDPDAPLITLRCAPEPERREACRVLFETVAAGFRLLAARFPANVRLEERPERGEMKL